MNLLQDIITYVRRIIKSPSNSSISDNLIIDYINRFWIMDVDARIQLFDLKTKYSFQTQPGVDQYNMPLYSIQTEPGGQIIGMYPVYQGFVGPAYIDGIQVPLDTESNNFFNIWPNIVQQLNVVGVGNGSSGPYTLSFPVTPNNSQPANPPFQYILRGHVDLNGIISYSNDFGTYQDPPLISSSQITTNANFIQTVPTTSVFPGVYITTIDSTGANVILTDSGQFLASNVNCGILIQPGSAPNGNLPLTNGPSPNYSATQNTINYLTGVATNVYFPTAIPAGNDISAQCFFFQCGLPRGILYYNNTLTLRSPPDTQYLVELDAYLSPAAFLNQSQAIPFGYMAEYIARGAARKILADTGDTEQFAFYEPLFKEQETLVWKRSQRQWTSTRTQTIYSQGLNQGQSGFNNIGGSTF
jgi:hypothetical protein